MPRLRPPTAGLDAAELPAPLSPRPVDDDGAAQSRPVALPALVNLIVPAGTLLGWSAAPAQAGALGLLDPGDTRAIAQAAARHPRTRWCATLVAPDGTAIAHGCARGQHPHLLDGLEPQPPPGNQEPQPTATRNHSPHRSSTSSSYCTASASPSPRSRGTPATTPRPRSSTPPAAGSATWSAPARRPATPPAARTPAANADLDHTRPWPDGPTSQGNLAPRCRTHHRAKQAPDWQVEQLAPGVTRWTLPSGRAHVTTPTSYDS